MYLHRQPGTLLLLAVLLPAAFCAWLAWTSGHRWLYLLAAAFVVVAWLFSSLTIQVNDHELVSWFGPGFWHVRAPLQRMAGVERTSSSALEGWGIRITTRGMLYNVSGRDAVEIRLDDGSRFRLGTDDPDGLVAALQARITRRNSA
jgi:hypothetical protein